MPAISRHRLLAWGLCGLCLWIGPPACGQEGAAPASETKAANGVPPLSVRSLFHPKDKFDYFSPSPPASKWLSDSRLAVQLDDRWQLMDPDSGELSPWDWPQVLAAELDKLTGFPNAAVKAAARASITTAENLERPLMVRIGDAIAVIGGGREPRLVTRDARAWQTPVLSGDGSAIAFVRENDLYVIKVETGEIVRLTQDGSPTRLNGRLDWTYQEEIYGRGKFQGFWWSPDSRQIAFLSIDIADVRPFTVTESRTPRGDTQVTRYPKAGDAIPKAALWVVDTDTLQLTPIHQPQGDEAETLVVRVTWRPGGRTLTYQIQNRIQSWLELRESDLSALQPRVLLREEGPAWVEILGEPHWLPAGGFLWLSDLPAGRRHLWRVSEDGTRRIPITSGDWDVREVLRVLPESRTVFVTGDRQRGTRGQQLYQVHWGEGSDAAKSVTPLTTAAGWHAPDISPGGEWFTDTFSTLTSEPIKTLRRVGGNQSRQIGKSDAERAAWKSLNLPSPQWLDFQTSDGVPLPAYMIPPHSLDAEESDQTQPSHKYPVLIFTYGGPQAPSAVDRWNGRTYLFHQLMASEGIGVLVVDNRSSGGRGIADTWSIHRRMGVQELADLLDAVGYLKQIPWVDGDRLAIRGWSFGGYYAAYALTHSTAFAAGIAGGSVTDWRNYDAFYTERYMDTPQNNEAGYRETSVVEEAEDIHGRLLLIHGEVDDNVHLANALQLIAALQQAGKMFDMMIYPNSAHGVAEANQVFHLHSLMMEFLRRELHPPSDN